MEHPLCVLGRSYSDHETRKMSSVLMEIRDKENEKHREDPGDPNIHPRK